MFFIAHIFSPMLRKIMEQNQYRKERKKLQNQSDEKGKIISECVSCGIELYDGDSAYLTSCGYFCPACIDASFTICREGTFGIRNFTKKETKYCGIKAYEIHLAGGNEGFSRKDEEN